jgi:hypothetical protein
LPFRLEEQQHAIGRLHDDSAPDRGMVAQDNMVA